MANKAFSLNCQCGILKIIAGEKLDSNKRMFETLELPAFLNPKLYQVYKLYPKSIITRHEANIKISNRNSGIYHIMCRSCQFDFHVKIVGSNAYAIVPNNRHDAVSITLDNPIGNKEITDINDLILIDSTPSSPVMINQSPIFTNENKLEYDDFSSVDESQFDNKNNFVIGSFSESPILYDQILFA